MLSASNPTEAEAAKARQEAKEAEAAAAAAAGGKKGDKKGDKKGGGKKDDKKGGKGKKGAEPEEPPDEPPEVGGPSEWSKEMESLLRAFEATWIGRDERDNVSQRYDEELAREVRRAWRRGVPSHRMAPNTLPTGSHIPRCLPLLSCRTGRQAGRR
jgi:hypothetical protein